MGTYVERKIYVTRQDVERARGQQIQIRQHEACQTLKTLKGNPLNVKSFKTFTLQDFFDPSLLSDTQPELDQRLTTHFQAIHST